MVYVGRFYKEDFENGMDRRLVEKYKKETGLNYVNTKIVENGNAMDIWVCSAEEFKI